jgi:hypothetical protein
MDKELERIKLKLAQAEITAVNVTDEELIVDLADRRTISVPILWFPRLAYGTPAERNNFQSKLKNRKKRPFSTHHQPAPNMVQ